MADDQFVTIEYRGMIGDLPVGSTVRVESWGAGVLKLRVGPMMGPASTVAHAPGTPKGDADAQVIKDEADATAREGKT